MSAPCPRCGLRNGLHLESCSWRHLTVGPNGERWPPPPSVIWPVARGCIAWAVLTAAGYIGARLILGPLSWPSILIMVCTALAALPPDWDPVIQIKRRRERARVRPAPPETAAPAQEDDAAAIDRLSDEVKKL